MDKFRFVYVLKPDLCEYICEANKLSEALYYLGEHICSLPNFSFDDIATPLFCHRNGIYIGYKDRFEFQFLIDSIKDMKEDIL